MKKGILLSLFAFAITANTELYAFQKMEGSTFVFVDLLEWQVREGGNQQWAELISPTGTTNPSVKLLDAQFAWNTGYRVGAGYKSPNDWDAIVYLTSFHVHASDQINAPGQLYSPYIGNFFQNNTNGSQNGPFYNAASISWKLAFNTLDLELGRAFKFNPSFKLRPFVGLKGAVINQDIYTNWQGPNTLFLKIPVPITSFNSATENLSHYFTGLGPAFGVDSTWTLFKPTRGSINLVGNFSTALMWGLWRFKDVYRTNTSNTVTTTTNDVNGAAPMVKGFVGLEWVGSLAKADVNVRLGYEGQVWFDQVQMNTLSSGRLTDIMSLQGAVFDFGMNF